MPRTIRQIEDEMLVMQGQRSKITNDVRTMQSELAQISAGNPRTRDVRRKTELVSLIALHTNEATRLKQRIHELNREIDAIKFPSGFHGNASAQHSTPATTKSLVALREKYIDFAKDPTRVTSLRRLAAEFVSELDPVIREAIESQRARN
jgi:hypothetical protein